MTPRLLWYNKLLDATVTASGTYAGYDVTSVLDMRNYTFWKANAAGTNFIKGAFSGATSISEVALCGHNLSSVGCVVSVEHSPDNSTWTEAATVTPTHNNAIMFSFTAVSKQYWRIKIVNASGEPYIGVLYFGTAIAFTYPPNGPLSNYEEGIEAENFVSKTGNLLGVIYRYNPVSFNHTFQDVDKTWASTNWNPFWHNHAKFLKPFFYAVDLTNAADVFFCRMKLSYVGSLPYSNANYYDTLTVDAEGSR